VSAEYSFKHYLEAQGIAGWKVGSAGIIADQAPMDPTMRTVLAGLGMRDIVHQQRRVTKEMLKEYDIVVGMAQNHIDFLEGEFGYKQALLFNFLADEGPTSVFDIADVIFDFQTNRPAVEQKIESTINYIYAKTPALFKRASECFYLFVDFVSGEKTHRNGLPFIVLHESPNTVAFMSADIPPNMDGHILVIPKKRFVDFSHIPPEIAEELFVSLATIGKAIGTSHDGYNILLNNGADAGQYIFHTHFHLVPRKRGDGILVEGWDHATISREKFIELNRALKKQIALEVAQQ
jgi:diadenosine tetraphosphate (Ap4A) HIT family hydrolase/protein-tyrosine-phosphatase